MTFEEELQKLFDEKIQEFQKNCIWMDDEKQHAAFVRMTKEECVEEYKQRVREILTEFENDHFADGEEHPSMKIHYSDFKALKERMGLLELQ